MKRKVSKDLEIRDRGDYLLVNFSGEFSVEAGKRCVDGIVDACLHYKKSAVLLDCSRMSGRLSVMDRFQVMDYGRVTSGTVTKFAMVGRPEDILPDNYF